MNFWNIPFVDLESSNSSSKKLKFDLSTLKCESKKDGIKLLSHTIVNNNLEFFALNQSFPKPNRKTQHSCTPYWKRKNHINLKQKPSQVSTFSKTNHPTPWPSVLKHTCNMELGIDLN